MLYCKQCDVTAGSALSRGAPVQSSSYLCAADSRDYESCEWISSQWLSKWMSGSTDADVSPVDNSRLCCQHQRYVSRWLWLFPSLHSMQSWGYVN